jgi:DNA polymerase-4
VIACVLIPFFAAAVERQLDPSLAASTLIIGEPAHAPQQVLAVSEEAVRCGVIPGLSLRQAQALCPSACLIPAKANQYQNILSRWGTVLQQFSQQVEQDEIGLAAISYLDLGRVVPREQVSLAQQLGRAVREQLQLAPTIGLASGKFTAYVAAASTAPNKAVIVAVGREASFLAPRSIHFLPLDEALSARLQRLGLRRLGQLASLPAGAMLHQFGRYGQWLHQLARGQDQRPVLARPPEVVEQVTRQFEGPITCQMALTMLNRELAVELANRLVASGRLARRVSLTLRLENEVAWEEQRSLRQPTTHPERLELILNALLSKAQVSCGVVAVAVKLSDLTPARGEQLDLFSPPTAQESRLQEALPHLIARYGATSFYRSFSSQQTAYLAARRFQLQPLDNV